MEKSNYDIGRFFASLRPGVLFLLVIVVYLGIVAFGVLIGYERFLKGNPIQENPIETAVASVLGLLAFMLGFMFSISWTRFTSRTALVILQTKAISVCWLRTSLITERQKQAIRKLLSEYVDILMSIQKTTELEKSLAKLDEIHLLIWEQTASLTQEEIDSEMRSLFCASVTDLISISSERKVRALYLKIPNAIWVSLIILSSVGMLAIGYQAGIGGIGRVFHLPLLPIAFGIVIVLIADLNTPYSQHNFRVTQKPYYLLLEMIKKNIP